MLLEHLYDALHSPLGIIIETDDPEFLRQKLYPLRKDRPEFANLAFVISPTHPDTELWILNTNGQDNREGTNDEAHALLL